jgi:hypothetical protein
MLDSLLPRFLMILLITRYKTANNNLNRSGGNEQASDTATDNTTIRTGQRYTHATRPTF